MGMHSKKKKQKSLKTRSKQILNSKVDKKKSTLKLDESEVLMEVDRQVKDSKIGEFGEKRKMNALQNVSIASKALQDLEYIPCSMKESNRDLNGDQDDRTTRVYAAEVRKTISAADIIIEVLDARDPFGSRSKQIEDSVLQSGKRLVLLLNKIDLVPKDNVKKWLAVLRTHMPTIAFKASTQEQQNKLGRLVTSNLHTDSSKCIGADLVMKLLKNYCRNKDIKTTIRVGIVGYPNVGKSSIINSLKRSKTCQTGSIPGVTKQLQEVELDKNIRLIDSPGVVLASKNQFDPVEVALKNALRVDALRDPISPVQGVLRRCSVPVLMEHFQIPSFDNHEVFLAFVAKKLGRLKKGGIPDIHEAAKHVLNEWNSGRLKYYTEPPVQVENLSDNQTQLLSTLSAEFDMDALDEDVKVILEETTEMEAENDEQKHNLVSSSSKVVVESGVKKNKDATEGFETLELIPKSLKIVDNVRLDTLIKKAVKKNKKKMKKIERKANELTDLFGGLGKPDPNPNEMDLDIKQE